MHERDQRERECVRVGERDGEREGGRERERKREREERGGRSEGGAAKRQRGRSEWMTHTPHDLGHEVPAPQVS